jgi:hypothetical protein
MSDAPLTTVATFLRRGEAEVARARLEAAGIAALVLADDEGGLSPGFFRDHAVRLLVDAADVGRAGEILRDEAL